MKNMLSAAVSVLCGTAILAAESPGFLKKPAAARKGEGAVISFAVDRETDVAVYVEDAHGRVVRHLVAGVLGTNAPLPLKPGLAQSIEWDGRDDDNLAATNAPFRVRVGLGLKSSWGGVAFADPGKSGPNMLEGLVTGIAVGPDGRAYVGQPHHRFELGSMAKTLVFRRGGEYERTIAPFPANLFIDRLKPAEAFINSFHAVNPRQGPYEERGIWFYPVLKALFQTPAVTPDGRIYMAGMDSKGMGVLTVMDSEGGIPAATYGGPALGIKWLDTPFLLAAADGTHLYAVRCVAGQAKNATAVYRIRIPDRGPAELFFGEPDKPGSDEKHLNDPRAMALDGKGYLLIADSGNNRVVVLKESDASWAGSFAVDGPTWLGVHRKTGAVYVLDKGLRLIKFAGWKDARELANLKVAHTPDPLFGRTAPMVALDATAEPAVIWLGTNCKGGGLLRCVDEGANFAPPVQARYYNPVFPVRAAADPTHRMVMTRLPSPNGPELRVLDDETGKSSSVIIGSLFAREYWHRLDRDGNFYGQFHCAGIQRYGSDGKPRPFPATGGDLPAGARGNSAWERDMWVDRKGDIYVNRTGATYHGSQTLEVYDQQGNLKRVALWSMTDGMYGPRVDARGNIVVMDIAKPPDQPYPNEFNGADPMMYDWFYGSVIKFGPQGGALWRGEDTTSAVDFENWRSYGRVAGLQTKGGFLTGRITKAPGWDHKLAAVITVPGRPGTVVDADKCKTVAIRLKNGTDGTKATFGIGRDIVDGLPVKTVEIKPNSDFTEYTFDLAGAKDWKGPVGSIYISPSDTQGEGTFAIDWIKVGSGEAQKVWNFNAEESAETKLPPELKTEKVRGFELGSDSVLQGALWHRPGFSAVSAASGAPGFHCFGTDFDMDDFGRVFAPDSLRFRVGVLDANGNEITSIGAYGNQDFCGPDSYVPDPAGKFLRPRRAGDPRDLVSPFAKPDVAFSWINGVAVTDGHAFVTDCINKRILRVKLDYAAQENCEVK